MLDPSKFPGFSANFTPDSGLSTAYTPAPSTGVLDEAGRLAGAAVRGAIPAVAPLAGGVAAAEAAQPIIAPIAAATGPFAPATEVVLSLGAGIAGAGATGYAQDKALDAMPAVRDAMGQSPDQIAADESSRDTAIAREVGGLIPAAAAFRPTNLLGKGLTAAERVAAGGSAVVMGGIGGAQEAVNEYANGQPLDPTKIGIEAAGSAAFSGRPRFGLPVTSFGRGEASPIAETPIQDNTPQDLLQLSDQRGEQPIRVPQPLALPSPEQMTPTSQAPGAQVTGFSEGLHPDATARNNPDFIGTDQGVVGPGVEGPAVQQPSAPSPFSVGDVFNKIGTDLDGGAVKGRDKPYALKVASSLADAFRSGDVDAARQMLAAESENLQASDLAKGTVDKRAAVLAAAHDVVDDFFTTPPGTAPAEATPGSLRDRLQSTEPAASAAEVTPEPGAAPPPEAAPPPSLSHDTANTLAQRSIENTSAGLTQAHRQGILDGILSDAATRNPTGRFIAELGRQGYDKALSESEAATIARFEDAKAAFSRTEESPAEPARAEATPPADDFSAPDESGNFGIRERGAPKKPIEPGLQARAPQRPFEMTGYSEADIARKEAAERRRQARAQGEPAPTEGDANAELFDQQGAPSMDVQRAQAIAAADRTLAEVKGKVARDVVQQAHDMMMAGDAEPELVSHVAEMTRQGKVAAARQLLSSITNKPEEGPPVTRTVDQVQTIRQAALDHIETSQMGSTKTQHFLAGVDAELGLKNQARPEGPTKQASYDGGRRFVREYQEPAADAKGDTAKEIQAALERGEISPGSAKLLTRSLETADPAKVRQNLDATIERSVDRQGLRARKMEPDAPAKEQPTLASVADTLRAKLDTMGLHDVGLRVADRFAEFEHDASGQPGGAYDPVRRLIDVALDSDPHATLDHEAIHAMRDLGLFKPEEWQVLVDAAVKDPQLVAYAKRYVDDGLSLDGALEEAVAEMHARWTDGPTGPVGKLVYRIRNFIEALRNALQGKGFQTADDVIRAIRSGDVGSREGFPMAESAVDPVKARKMGLGDVHASAADATNDTLDTVRKASLNFLAVRQFKHYFPQLKQPLEHFWEALAQSGAARSDRQFRSAQVVDALNKLKPQEREAVGRLGLDATAAKLDPLKPGNEMSQRLAAMSPQAQATYAAARQDLERQLDDYKAVRKAIIEQDTDLSPAEKKSAQAAVDAEGLQVYWPMKRFGDLLAVSKSKDYASAEQGYEAARQAYNDAATAGADDATQVKLREAMASAQEALKSVPDGKMVTAFEKRSELMAHVKAMQDQGYEVATTTKPKGGIGGSANVPELRAVNRALDHQIAEEQARAEKLTGDDKKASQRTVEALEGMKSMMAEVHATFSPEGSALRAGMRRKGVAGFSEDGVRSYALASQQNAGFVSAMEFGAKARKALGDLHAAALKTGDYTQMQAYDQLKKHYDELGRYANTPFSRILTNAAYAYNLAASPSFMAMHLMQTPLVTAPVMGARFGYGRTIGELAKAGGEVVEARGRGHVTPESLGKTPGETEMLKLLERHGTVSTSDAAALAEAADPKGAVGKASEKVMAVASYLPHHTERFNRLATALADYRLALKDSNLSKLVTDEQLAKARTEGWQGTKEELAAALHAQEVTLDTHVDYGKDNAPYYMQAHDKLGLSKLMFQFQKYQQAMIEFEVRSLKDMMDKNLAPEERLVALRTLIGVVGSHAIMTGVQGLPGVGAVAFLMNAYHKMLGNKDDPWDAETAFRRFMNEHFGLDMGNVLARGVLYVPGIRDVVPADVTDRLGMGDLLSPTDRLDGVDRQDLVQYIGAAVGGPAGGMLGNFLHGYNLMRQGKTERGLEQFMPKAARDIAKTVRFMNEGAETEGGAPIVERDDLTPADLLAQAAGFTPQKVATAQANKEAIDSAKEELKARRGTLTEAYEHAVTSGDAAGAAQAMQAIQDYNATRQGEGMINQVIKPSDLSSAVRQHMMEHILLSQGVALNPKDRPLVEEGLVGS